MYSIFSRPFWVFLFVCLFSVADKCCFWPHELCSVWRSSFPLSVKEWMINGQKDHTGLPEAPWRAWGDLRLSHGHPTTPEMEGHSPSRMVKIFPSEYFTQQKRVILCHRVLFPRLYQGASRHHSWRPEVLRESPRLSSLVQLGVILSINGGIFYIPLIFYIPSDTLCLCKAGFSRVVWIQLLLNGTIRYFSWPRDTMKISLKRQGFHELRKRPGGLPHGHAPSPKVLFSLQASR